MMRAPTGWLIVALALLTGCATTAVKAPAPTAAPAAWSARIEPPGAAAVPVAAWWEELADGQLNRLVEQALQDGTDVQVAAARVRQARAFAREADANRMPQLDLGVAGMRQRIAKSSVRDTEGGTLAVPAYRQSNMAARVDARYEVDLLGRLALDARAAAADSAASSAELRAVRQWLAGEVVLAYAALRLADERAAMARDAGMLLDALRHSTQERLGAGLAARDQVRAAEGALAATRDLEAALRHARHAALAHLATLVGTSAGALRLEPHAEYFGRLGLSGAVTPDLPAAALGRRADVDAAWQRLLAASDRAERARLERYPALSLTGSAGLVTEALRRWLTGDALAWVAQAAVQGPLFDGGRIAARTEQAHAEVDALHAQHRKLMVAALAETETALSATQAARDRVALADAELARRVADRQAVADRRAVGLASGPELLQKEVDRLTARDSLSTRRYELLVAWAGAQRALGR